MAKNKSNIYITDNEVSVDIVMESLRDATVMKIGYDPANPYGSLLLTEQDKQLDKDLDEAASIIAAAKKIRTGDLTIEDQHKATRELIERFSASSEDVQVATASDINRTVRAVNSKLSSIEDEYQPTQQDKDFVERVQNTLPYASSTADTMTKFFQEYKQMSLESREYVLGDLKELYQEYRASNIDKTVRPEIYSEVVAEWQALPKRFSHTITFDESALRSLPETTYPSQIEAERSHLANINAGEMKPKDFYALMADYQEHLKTADTIRGELIQIKEDAIGKFAAASDALNRAKEMAELREQEIAAGKVPDPNEQLPSVSAAQANWTRTYNAITKANDAIDAFNANEAQIMAEHKMAAHTLYHDYMQLAEQFAETHPRSREKVNALTQSIFDEYIARNDQQQEFLTGLAGIKHDIHARQDNIDILNDALKKYEKMSPEDKVIVQGPLLREVEQFNGNRLATVEAAAADMSMGLALRDAVKEHRGAIVNSNDLDHFQQAIETLKKVRDEETPEHRERVVAYLTQATVDKAEQFYNSGKGMTAVLINDNEGNAHAISHIVNEHVAVSKNGDVFVTGQPINVTFSSEQVEAKFRSREYFETNADFEKHLTVQTGNQGLYISVPYAQNNEYGSGYTVTAENVRQSFKVLDVEETHGLTTRTTIIAQNENTNEIYKFNTGLTMQDFIQRSSPDLIIRDSVHIDIPKAHLVSDAMKDSILNHQREAVAASIERPVFTISEPKLKMIDGDLAINVPNPKSPIPDQQSVVHVMNDNGKATFELYNPKNNQFALCKTDINFNDAVKQCDDLYKGVYGMGQPSFGEKPKDTQFTFGPDDKTPKITTTDKFVVMKLPNAQTKELDDYYITNITNRNGVAHFDLVHSTNGRSATCSTQIPYAEAIEKFDVLHNSVLQKNVEQIRVNNLDGVDFAKTDEGILVTYTNPKDKSSHTGYLMSVDYNHMSIREGSGAIVDLSCRENRKTPDVTHDDIALKLMRTQGVIVTDMESQLYIGDGKYSNDLIANTQTSTVSKGEIVHTNKDAMIQNQMNIAYVGDELTLTYNHEGRTRREEISYIQATQRQEATGENVVDLKIVSQNGDTSRIYNIEGLSQEEFRKALAYDKLHLQVSDQQAWDDFRNGKLTEHNTAVAIDALNKQTPAISVDNIVQPKLNENDIRRAELVEQNGQFVLKGVDRDNAAINIANPIITRNNQNELIVYSVNETGEKDQFRIVGAAAGKYAEIERHASEKNFDYSRVLNHNSNAICENIEKYRTVGLDINVPSRDLNAMFSDRVGISAELTNGTRFTPDMIRLNENSSIAEKYGVIIQEGNNGPSFTYYNDPKNELIEVRKASTPYINSSKLPQTAVAAEQQGYLCIDRANNIAVKNDGIVYKINVEANDTNPSFSYTHSSFTDAHKANAIATLNSQTAYLQNIPKTEEEARKQNFLLIDYDKGIAIREGGLVYAIKPQDLMDMAQSLDGKPRNFYDERIATPIDKALENANFVAPEKFALGVHDIKPMVNEWNMTAGADGKVRLSFAETSLDQYTPTLGGEGHVVKSVYISDDGKELVARVQGNISHETNSTTEIQDIRLGRPTQEQMEFIDKTTQNVVGNAGDRLQYWVDNVNDLSLGRGNVVNDKIEFAKVGDLVLIQETDKSVCSVWTVERDIDNNLNLVRFGPSDGKMPSVISMDSDILQSHKFYTFEPTNDAYMDMAYSRNAVYAEPIRQHGDNHSIVGMRMGERIAVIEGEEHITQGITTRGEGKLHEPVLQDEMEMG